MASKSFWKNPPLDFCIYRDPENYVQAGSFFEINDKFLIKSYDRGKIEISLISFFISIGVGIIILFFLIGK